MALHQGLFDRDGRVLEKVNRLVESGAAALDAGSETRAAIAFVKALGLLEVREPAARFEEFAKAFSAVGDGLLRVGRLESAQAAANQALGVGTALTGLYMATRLFGAVRKAWQSKQKSAKRRHTWWSFGRG